MIYANNQVMYHKLLKNRIDNVFGMNVAHILGSVNIACFILCILKWLHLSSSLEPLLATQSNCSASNQSHFGLSHILQYFIHWIIFSLFNLIKYFYIYLTFQVPIGKRTLYSSHIQADFCIPNSFHIFHKWQDDQAKTTIISN